MIQNIIQACPDSKAHDGKTIQLKKSRSIPLHTRKLLSMTLSYTEIMYLQTQITKKLYQEGDCLRKLVAHKKLLMRLLPLAEIADQEMWKARERTERALEAANCWLEIGQYERLRMFEYRICMYRLFYFGLFPKSLWGVRLGQI